MERKKYFLIITFFVFCTVLFGQNDGSIYKAFISGNMARWKSSMDSIDAVKQKSNKEILDLINYQYGYIAWCISNKYSDQAKRYLGKARENLQLLENKSYNVSMLYAYKAAFIGFDLGLSPLKAPFIGPKSIDYAKKSVTLDPMNPLGYLQLGNIAWYAPKLVGGSKTDAMCYYLKALNLMEKNPDQTVQNWNYLNLFVTLINACSDSGKYQIALEYCLKALAAEPEFDWVKKNLYPQIVKKVKQ
jgi:tetratricopeptide (TPR) repeat protein